MVPHEIDEDEFDVAWDSRAAYDARGKPVVDRQLVAAGQNLAALLNAIWP